MFRSRNLWLLIAAVLMLSMQILAVIIYIFSFIPMHVDDSFLVGMEHTRDAFFYTVFLGLNVGLMAFGLQLFWPAINTANVGRDFKLWLGLESLWCFCIWFVFFKWTTYRYPFWNILPFENNSWLRLFFCGTCGLALVSKIFFPEICRFSPWFEKELGKSSVGVRYSLGLPLGLFVFLLVLLYVPHPQQVAALAFAWDQFNHLDHLAGWCVAQGWYLSYEQIIQMLVVLSLLYLAGVFYFIRRWLGSPLLAGIGVLLVARMGLFYYSEAPCVWMNPSNTFLAHGLDIIFLIGLGWVQSHRPKKFWLASGITGLICIIVWTKSNGLLDAAGMDNQPMMAPLRVRQFFPFFMGYFLPVFYVGALIAIQERLVTVLSIYGLMLFVQYICHPAIGYYGALILPAVLIFLWGIKQSSAYLPLVYRRGLWLGVLIVAAGALCTNRLMLSYPNLLFQDPNRFAQEENLYEQMQKVYFEPSASLIDQLTGENQKIVLISNFEVALCQKAHRQSLFKDIPIMDSGLSNLGGLKLRTRSQLQDLMGRMEGENAAYVFVDLRLWNLTPKLLGSSSLVPVLAYLQEHYQVYAQKGLIVAVQRK